MVRLRQGLIGLADSIAKFEDFTSTPAPSRFRCKYKVMSSEKVALVIAEVDAVRVPYTKIVEVLWERQEELAPRLRLNAVKSCNVLSIDADSKVIHTHFNLPGEGKADAVEIATVSHGESETTVITQSIELSSVPLTDDLSRLQAPFRGCVIKATSDTSCVCCAVQEVAAQEGALLTDSGAAQAAESLMQSMQVMLALVEEEFADEAQTLATDAAIAEAVAEAAALEASTEAAVAEAAAEVAAAVSSPHSAEAALEAAADAALAEAIAAAAAEEAAAEAASAAKMAAAVGVE